MPGEVHLPKRTRGQLVAAARAGEDRETLPDYEARRRKAVEDQKPRMLTAPIQKNKGSRVEIDRSHYVVMELISVLAVRWKDRLEASGLPATDPVLWRNFADACRDFKAIDHAVGHFGPGEANDLVELLKMRDELSDGG